MSDNANATDNAAHTSPEEAGTSSDVPVSGKKSNSAKDKTVEKVLAAKDIIIVKSLVPMVFYTCPVTHDSFFWYDIGETQELTFAQLKTIAQQHRRFFTEKWIIPLNDEAIGKLQLKDIFNVNFDLRRDMKLLYNGSIDQVREKLEHVAEDDYEPLKAKIIKATKAGKIDNVKILRLLEKHFDIELMDLV